jgi:hypothetical protein
LRPKILLLQARRADDPMAGHEHDCFFDRSGLPAEEQAAALEQFHG